MAVKSGPILRMVPQKLVRHLKPEEMDSNPVLLDVETEPGGDSTLFQLDVIFHAIPVRSSVVIRSPFYVGAIGAEITIRAIGAKIIDYTEPSSIRVKHSLITKVEEAKGIKVSPELKLKPLAVKLGSVDNRVKQDKDSTTEFSSDEELVAVTLLGDMIRWNIDIHRGEKAVRDFLLGNRYLCAIFKWKDNLGSGNILLRRDIRFFDSDKRLFSGKASVGMRFVIWQQNISLNNAEGFEWSFSEAA